MILHERAQKVIALAGEEAGRMNDTVLRDGHVLVAMVREGTSVVSKKLCEIGADLDEIRRRYKKCRMPCLKLSRGALLQSTILQGALECAARKALEMGDQKVCPIYVFSALAVIPDSDTVAVLKSFKLDVDRFVREAVADYEEKKQPSLKLRMLVGITDEDGIHVRTSFDIARESEQKALLKSVDLSDDWEVVTLVAKIRKRK